TLLMNMFFGSRLKGMPPKLVSDDGRNVVIRPLAYVAEPDLERWAEHRRFQRVLLLWPGLLRGQALEGVAARAAARRPLAEAGDLGRERVQAGAAAEQQQRGATGAGQQRTPG
ncbi:MAG: hypothetical protein ACK57B_07820, partial [Betaproteobacteria bacterium]